MGKKRKIDVIEAVTMPAMNVSLYHSRNKLSRDLRRHGIELDLSMSCEAQTITTELDGITASFVLMELSDDSPLWVQLGLLAHEATHVAVHYLSGIGEEEPGEEELAYAVQAAAGCLFDMHLTWLRKREGRGNEKEG